jgi:hypothetical protein
VSDTVSSINPGEPQKNVADWLRNKRTQESLNHLGSNMGIPMLELYQVFEGVPDNGGGTWGKLVKS